MGAERLKGAALPRAASDVLMDLADLVQKELRLARAELSAKLTTKLRAGIWVSIAAGCALVAVLFAAEGVVIWITNFGIALHLSCLIVAGVMAAAASHIQSVDGVWPDIRDPEGLLKDALQARRLGFTGKSLIHPGQIEIVNNTFRPDEGEVEYARQVIQAFEDGQARGDGAVALGGQLIDAPIVDRARRTLALFDALGATAPAS